MMNFGPLAVNKCLSQVTAEHTSQVIGSYKGKNPWNADWVDRNLLFLALYWFPKSRAKSLEETRQ